MRAKKKCNCICVISFLAAWLCGLTMYAVVSLNDVQKEVRNLTKSALIQEKADEEESDGEKTIPFRVYR